MNRRNLLTGLAASALAGSSLGAAEEHAPNTFYELKRYQLHTTPEKQPARVSHYLESGYAPAIERAGGKLIGAFTNYIGPEAPCVIALTQFASLAAFQEAHDKLGADSVHLQALETMNAGPGYPYLRVESSLLRAFDGMPQPLLSSAGESHAPRFFEMRRYESQTDVSLARKLRMFADGEIAIFVRLGMRPVFFGETLVGPAMPNLVYMLSFDDLTARETLWHEFGSDPAWKKLSSPPDLHDDEVVANISNVILRPLSFSLIR